MTRLRTKVLAGAMGAAVITAATPPIALAATSNTPKSGSALTGARQMLETAERELAEARRTEALVRKQAADGAIDAALMANIQPDDQPTYRPGASEIELIAGLMGTATPEVTLREATIEELATGQAPEPEAIVPNAPVVITTPKQALASAADRVAEARADKEQAKQLIEQLSGATSADGPGARQLARLCANADVVVELCQPVRWNEAHLRFDTVMIGRTVNVTWPAVKEVGGYRPYDPYPDHPSGRAADIMMPNGGLGSDVQLGNEIAKYFQKNADEYGIYYMLWRQKMWKNGDPVGAWTSVSDRGSPTANHMDHVHISVTTGSEGNAWRTWLQEARKEAKDA